MKFRSLPILVFISIFSFVSCTKDRIFEKDPIIITPSDSNAFYYIKINEVLAKGSLLTTDLGNTSDWIELYNSASQSYTLKQGTWFISDNPADPEKFELPERTIGPGDFLVIFCDDSIRLAPQIHTNFGLSSSGEHVALYHKVNNVSFVVDSTSFGLQTEDNMSNARTPDGVNNWIYPSNPTPGNPNQ